MLELAAADVGNLWVTIPAGVAVAALTALGYFLRKRQDRKNDTF